MTDLSKSDYLKRYMSGGDVDKKKKKKKSKDKDNERPPKKLLTGIRIVETDAFASVAAASDIEDVDSDEELEIQMLNEEIRNKAKKGSMKGAFKSTFTSIDDPPIKSEPLEEQSNGKEIKEETSTADGSKFQISLGKTKAAEKEQNSSRRRHDSDTDDSPIRSQHHSTAKETSRKENKSPKRVRHDSDNSPPRKRRHDSSDESPPRRKRHDSDNSPPRRRHNDSKREIPRRRQRRDSDNSPVRRRRHDSDESPPRRRQRRDSDQSPPRPHRRKDSESPQRAAADSKQRTLDGKVAGLQSAKDLQEESDRLRARKAKMFDELDPSVSGRDAETQIRKSQVTRGRRDKPEDVEKKEREAKKQAELAEKYKDWNKGVKQLKDRQEQLDELARVVAGPMTRTAEDVDMNQYLKEKIYEADPMSSMIKKKNREEAIDRGDLVYPTYDKPFPPNRYGIRPGYRWDGVDRSNGFEAKLAISQNARQAVEREMYSNSNVFD